MCKMFTQPCFKSGDEETNYGLRDYHAAMDCSSVMVLDHVLWILSLLFEKTKCAHFSVIELVILGWTCRAVCWYPAIKV